MDEIELIQDKKEGQQKGRKSNERQLLEAQLRSSFHEFKEFHEQDDAPIASRTSARANDQVNMAADCLDGLVDMVEEYQLPNQFGLLMAQIDMS